MPKHEVWKDGVLQETTDTRTLKDAQDERIAHMDGKCWDELLSKYPIRKMIYALAGALPTAENTAIINEIKACRAKADTKKTDIQAKATNDEVDTVEWV